MKVSKIKSNIKEKKDYKDLLNEEWKNISILNYYF
tara:strand:+ start:553 stop:657 length:105 start_codon:yes stop_codon:yes gene_type:complete